MMHQCALFATSVMAIITIGQSIVQAQPANTEIKDSTAPTMVEESDRPAVPAVEHAWTLRVEPFVGYIGPAGDLRLPSSTTRGGEVTLESLNLDSPRVVPIGRIHAHRGNWRFTLSGFGFDASDRDSVRTEPGQIGAVAFATGDRFTADLRYESFELLASYRVLQHVSETDDHGRTRVDVGVDIVGGLRFHHADIDIRNQTTIVAASGTPALASADEIFAEPVIGARLDLNIIEQFGVEVESVAGAFGLGDRSSFSFSIDAGFVYRPVAPIGIKVGYRLSIFDLSDDEGAAELNWSGSMAGLYFGAQFSF